jgi:hypothetical protein
MKVRSSKFIIIRFPFFNSIQRIFHIYKPGFLIAIYRDSDRCLIVISKNLVDRVTDKIE